MAIVVAIVEPAIGRPVGVPNLIDDMNRQRLAFTVHDGDLKAGAGDCTDAIYFQALAYFQSLESPAIFPPAQPDDAGAGQRSA